eukprot:GDKJ01031841.1.p1 GENE.GDKJ01031841.1~~GDKJ01031841.1.p1  ORF type:complete len:149 (+),score=68.55 GDKJ01031841.1:50-448(+)
MGNTATPPPSSKPNMLPPPPEALLNLKLQLSDAIISFAAHSVTSPVISLSTSSLPPSFQDCLQKSSPVASMIALQPSDASVLLLDHIVPSPLVASLAMEATLQAFSVCTLLLANKVDVAKTFVAQLPSPSSE